MIVGCLRGVSVRLYGLCGVPQFLRYPVCVTRGYVLACLRGPVHRPIHTSCPTLMHRGRVRGFRGNLLCVLWHFVVSLYLRGSNSCLWVTFVALLFNFSYQHGRLSPTWHCFHSFLTCVVETSRNTEHLRCAYLTQVVLRSVHLP